MDNDTLVNVLWVSMDPGTRSHVSTKIDADGDVDFQVMREAVMRHTTLAGATSGSSANRPSAMDIGSIGSVTDADQKQQQQEPEGGGEAPSEDWYGEGSWPTEQDEEEWVGQVNLFKAKGKGKGLCFNCGKSGHYQAQCTNPPSKGKGKGDFKGKGKGDFKGKGKGKGGPCWTCGQLGHRAADCRQGKGRGYVNTLCSLKEVGKGRKSNSSLVPSDRAASSNAAVKTTPSQIVGGAFAPLATDESDDEEEEVPGFQSQKDLYGEKKKMQEEYAEREKKKEISSAARQVPVPPPPQSVAQRPPKKRRERISHSLA